MESALETLQLAGVKLITAHPFFTPVPVLHERLLNVQAKLAAALGQLKGIAILILTPIGRNTTPGAPQVNLAVDLVVEVAESVMLNTSSKGTQLAASTVAEQVAAHLHWQPWKPGKTLVCTDIALIPNKSLVVYRVTFNTSAQLVAL